MLVLVSFGRAVRPAMLFGIAAAASLFGNFGAAQADSPEYWTRETFRTEKPTITASLDSAEPASERRASRPAQPRASVAAADRDETPAPRRQASATERCAFQPGTSRIARPACPPTSDRR